MVAKVLFLFAFYIAIATNPVWSQQRGSAAAAAAREAQRIQQSAIAGAASGQKPILDGHADDCARGLRKYGFNLHQAGNTRNQPGILFPSGQYLQLFPQGIEDNVVDSNPMSAAAKAVLGDWPIPKFPGCAIPTCVAPSVTWDTPNLQAGQTEILELVLAHKDVMKILADIFNLEEPYNSSIHNGLACTDIRLDFSTFKLKFTGFGNKVSDEMQCVQSSSGAWSFNCVSKKGRAMSVHALRSDASGYVLVYQCWNSGEQTWSLYKRRYSDFEVTTDVKWNVLKTLEPVGFSPCDYEIFDWKQCKRY